MSLLNKKTRAKDIDRRQSLAGIPMVHENVIVAPRSKDTIALRKKVHRGPGLIERLRPPVMTRSYDLDEFGTFVVRQMDRKNTVHDIIKKFSAHFNMTFRESEMGVVAFIKMLMKRDMVSVGIKDSSE